MKLAIPWNKGRKETRPEVIERQRQSHLGMTLSLEHREAIGRSLCGHSVPEDTREKIRGKMLGRAITWGGKISDSSIGRTHTTATKQKIAATAAERWRDSQYRERVSKSIRCSRSKPSSKLVTSRISRARWESKTTLEKRRWIERIARANGSGQSGWEKIVRRLLTAIAPGQWRFTGARRRACLVETYTPDFMHPGQRKIIEVDCSYWHKNKARDQKRNATYRRHGYRVLCVTDTLFANRTNLERKLREFTNG